MRTLFIICTALTLLQIFDVSIKGVLSAGEKGDKLGKPKAGGNNTKPGNSDPSKTGGNNTKPGNSDPSKTGGNNTKPGNSDPGTNPNDDDSTEANPPKTIKESGKRVVKTLRKMATNRGVGLLNGVTGFLKKSGGVFNFFENFLRDRSSKVKDVAKQSLGMVGSFSDSSARGASHLLNSGKTIATQGGKELYSALQKVTKFGTNVTRLGGTVASTPVSIAENVVDTANRIARIPSKLSKTVTNSAIKPILSYMGSNSDEQPDKEEDGEEPAATPRSNENNSNEVPSKEIKESIET